MVYVINFLLMKYQAKNEIIKRKNKPMQEMAGVLHAKEVYRKF